MRCDFDTECIESANFNALGLKKLIATCYATSPIIYTQLTLFGEEKIIGKEDSGKKSYKIEITEVTDENNDGRVDLSDVEYLLKNRKNNLTLLNSDSALVLGENELKYGQVIGWGDEEVCPDFLLIMCRMKRL